MGSLPLSPGLSIPLFGSVAMREAVVSGRIRSHTTKPEAFMAMMLLSYSTIPPPVATT